MEIKKESAAIASMAGRASESVLVLDEIGSTNTELKRMAREGGEAGLVLIADSQSAGRGRLGRSFFSPARSGLYFSILLKPKTLDAGRLTTMAAVVTSDAVSSLFGIEVGIKWVNDLFFGKKKLCGILAEGVGNGMAVLGIGINLERTAFPPELAELATSIEEISGEKPSRNQLAAELIMRLDKIDLESNSHMEEYRRRSILLGQEVFLPSGERVLVRDIADSGALVVEKDGRLTELATGEVSVRWQ